MLSKYLFRTRIPRLLLSPQFEESLKGLFRERQYIAENNSFDLAQGIEPSDFGKADGAWKWQGVAASGLGDWR